jgi:hypothetical protein
MSSANQTILWNTDNRIPAFIQMSPPKRDLEFKRITDSFYRENANKPILSIDELRELNRKTVLAFLPSTSSSTLSREKPPLHPSTPVSESNMVETRQEKQERAFQDRQNMYAQMTEKPNPPVPEMFKETVEDVKITNMDELIASYQKQRNLEIPVIPIPSVIPSITKQEKSKITFLEGAVDPISLDIEDIDIDLEKEKENREKKNLAWNINLEETRVIEDSYLQELEKRIGKLEQKLKIETERREKIEEKWDRKEIEETMTSMLVSISPES